jgi:hypothetical protein
MILVHSWFAINPLNMAAILEENTLHFSPNTMAANDDSFVSFPPTWLP